MVAELLTVDELREHVENTALGDDALQRLLDAAEADINSWCGPLVLGSGDAWEEIEEHFYGREAGQSILRLKHYPDSVSEVAIYDYLEDETLLVEGREEDYVVDGQLLRRYGYYWGYHTKVTYVPRSSASQRRAALILLVQLAINVQPGQGFTGAATWQETYKDYETEKQHILWSLCPPPVFA